MRGSGKKLEEGRGGGGRGGEEVEGGYIDQLAAQNHVFVFMSF